MNVKELKELIKELPDDTPVLVPGGDHDYRRAYGHIEDASYSKEKETWSEHYPGGKLPKGSITKTVVIID